MAQQEPPRNDAEQIAKATETTARATEAAEQGLAEAQCHLGFMYNLGEGIPEDTAQAAVWYRKAAEQGYAPAQYNLGLMYDHGNGLPEDKAQAARWFRKAAGQGIAEARYNLGIMYYYGDGLPRDMHEAIRWLRMAAKQGDVKARKALWRDDIRKAFAADLAAGRAARTIAIRPERRAGEDPA